MDMDIFSFPDYVMKVYQPQETYIGGRPCRTRQPADALLNCCADPPNFVLSPTDHTGPFLTQVLWAG